MAHFVYAVLRISASQMYGLYISMMRYKKTLRELEKVAVKWWPKALESQVAATSVIPKLLETQDKFLSILKLSSQSAEHVLRVVEVSEIPANLFLKHLVVLSDYGGELIKRLGNDFTVVFPEVNKSGRRCMTFVHDGKTESYEFKSLPVTGLSNTKLRIDGAAIARAETLNDTARDVIMILLYGGASTSSHLASLEKCTLGGLLGNVAEIDRFVRQKYIEVSRITTGASANSLGQIAQTYVAEYLREKLDQSYSVQRNGKVKLKSYDSEGGMPFDVVVARGKRIVGVEVSFQVTSNSVIERKAALAEDRLVQMSREGHYVAYVLDGAGNFSRSAALTTLCQSSDCTVAYSEAELSTLVEFIQGKLDDSVR